MTHQIKRPKRPLQQLKKAEANIAKQVQMSNIIERLHAEHNEQLDFTHEQAHKKGYSAGRLKGASDLANQKKR
ncbi:hypothetical protein DX910_14560 [Acinetobacter haemolyticus]|nr:hypothetical protein DX910_14560 [Acinetobacter haemolyticus]